MPLTAEGLPCRLDSRGLHFGRALHIFSSPTRSRGFQEHVSMAARAKDLLPKPEAVNWSGRLATSVGSKDFGACSICDVWCLALLHKVSPEIMARDPHSTPADLFSLGAVVWVTLTGGWRGAPKPAPALSMNLESGLISISTSACRSSVHLQVSSNYHQEGHYASRQLPRLFCVDYLLVVPVFF